jgi:hypothetical protein
MVSAIQLKRHSDEVCDEFVTGDGMCECAEADDDDGRRRGQLCEAY